MPAEPAFCYLSTTGRRTGGTHDDERVAAVTRLHAEYGDRASGSAADGQEAAFIGVGPAVDVSGGR